MSHRILRTNYIHKFKYEYYPVYKIQKKFFGIWITKVVTTSIEESFVLLEKVKNGIKKPNDEIIFKE